MEKKRKFCSVCNDEYSERYFRRHLCNKSRLQEETVQCDSEFIESPQPIEIYNDSEDSSSEPGNSSNDETDQIYEMDEIFELSEHTSEDEMEDISDTIELPEFRDSFDSEENTASFDNDKSYLMYIIRIMLDWKSRFFISDLAMSFILLVMKTLLYLCATSDFSKFLYQNFPSNLYQLDKFVSYSKNNFQKYVVCPKCFSLYKYSDCVEIIEGIKQGKRCTHISFPRHPKRHFRRPCGEHLLKSTHINGHEQLIARKTYCYKSIKESLQTCVLRKGFEKKCESWRCRNVAEDIMMDVYDGDVWKEFQQNHDFLKHERNYALMLNVDWFQPFKHTNYSVGAIYVTILNLPREERFKRENVILIGLIPDMKSEPPTNTFLELFVEELNEAWDGFYMKSFTSSTVVKFRLALLCVGCDVPASRKLCGFLGHNATMGCNKCMKSFPGTVGEKSYGGFDIACWGKRTLDSHKKIVAEIVKAKTKGQKEELERKYGVRYSVLLELPYFDPVRMTIIDPMHNLFLGTAKRVLHLWIQHGILDNNAMKNIEQNVEKIVCPSDVGKIPQKFSTSFGSFNADQWKNWTILFSMYALKDIVPASHLDYWQKFVIACKLLCSKAVTKNTVKVAQLLLLSFCQKLEDALGEEAVTPNMHLHGHLDQCLYDFGPVYSFWLFSFERENGILGSTPTNKRFIEIQLMENFLKHIFTFDLVCDETIVPNFCPHFVKLEKLYDGTHRGTLGKVSKQSDFNIIHMSSRTFDITAESWTLDLCSQVQTSSLRNIVLEDKYISMLTRMYQVLYPNTLTEDNMVLCRTCRTSKSITLCGSLLGCKGSRSVRSSMVVAYWHGEDGRIACFDDTDLAPHPGQIQRLIVHNVMIDGMSQVHVLAHVKWYKCCTDNVKYYYGKPIEVWCSDMFEPEGPASFIPVQRIRSKFVCAYETLNGKNTIVVIPRERFTT